MGDWQHPEHFTAEARAYAEATRAAEIAIFIETVLPRLRAAAREQGYTLAVHGSQRRDLDLIAVPWTESASDATEVLKAICAATASATGWGNRVSSTSPKPHGRIAATIVASFQLELDVSVVPRLSEGHPSVE